ncbi:Crp/Fnr family transcriptional regulator [Hoeflea sp.]|uniref:Crp/Fnr family transcriptional regulator n=1 Tax=Hoeflea sp. TaxID=1940281 RepID=UPI0019998547|nr:Crp/Fnr family transcriptional regulator [Hoeflea sp.]MBC7282943.1 Crp/Fnr family transcriptional regulator [Hoeflea sp.]
MGALTARFQQSALEMHCQVSLIKVRRRNILAEVSCACGKREICVVHSRSLCNASSPGALAQLNHIAHRRTFPRGSIIQAQGENCNIVGNIVEGVVKLSSASFNGDEHIVGLLFPSDFLGRLFAEESRFSYEAATDVTLCSMNKPAFERFLLDHPTVEHEMLKAKLDELDAVREWAAITSGHTTMQRVATLLYVFSRRTKNLHLDGDMQSPSIVQVPLNRRDIADYLGTTPETLSRNIQTLARSKVIRIINAKHFELLDTNELIKHSGESRTDLNRIASVLP